MKTESITQSTKNVCIHNIQQAKHEKAKYAKAPAGDIQTKFLLKVDPQLSEKEGKKLVDSCEYEREIFKSFTVLIICC